MPKSDIDEPLLRKIYELLKDQPDAAQFVIAYRNYIHAVDDIIDEPSKRTAEFIMEISSRASILFTLPFWLEHGPKLIVLDQMINNTFADSVIWENSDVEWQKRDAMVLRHCGIDMFLAVIFICFGRDKMREISLDFRKQAHLLHMDEGGNFV